MSEMFKKGFNNIKKFANYANDKIDQVEWTMSNLMDTLFDVASDKSNEGKFKAVCLSGVADFDNSTLEDDGYMKIVVRPITAFGDMAPDPREYQTAEEINRAIAVHAGLFTARSDFPFADHSPIKFGQIITCYYDKGSISKSRFRGLRFEEPLGVQLEKSFLDLASIEGVSAGSLFTPPGQFPGAMQQMVGVINSIQQFLAGQGGAGGPSGPLPPEATAFQGGNCAEEPNKVMTPAQCGELGLNSNTKGKRKFNPTHIVVHCTAGSSNALQTLKGQNKGGLGYHFIIDRDGTFLQTAHPDLLIHHAGGERNISKQRYGGKARQPIGDYRFALGVCWANMAGDVHKKPYTIKDIEKLPGYAGIIEANPFNFDDKKKVLYPSSRVKNHEKYGQAAIDTGVKICAILCLNYGIDPENIWRHQHAAAKGDPGGTFYPIESEQGKKYDPELVEFKKAVRGAMGQMKSSYLKDAFGRYVAGWNAPSSTPPNPTPGGTPGSGAGESPPDGTGTNPTSHNGNQIVNEE